MNFRDASSFGFEVDVAAGAGADDEQIAVAEVIGESGESPAENHHIRRGESEREFFRRSVLVLILVRRQPIVQQLAGVEAVAFAFAERELDAETMFVREFVAVVFEFVHGWSELRV